MTIWWRNKMYMLLFLWCVFSYSNAFLLDTNTPGQSGSLISDDRYDALLKLFMDERKARLQLQHYVYQQALNISLLNGMTDNMDAQLSNMSSKQEQAVADMTLNYAKLAQMYNAVNQNNIQLRQELNIANNKTKELESEIENLKQVATINQLQTLGNLQQQLQVLQRDVNSLTVNSQARGQDLMAMYKELSENKQKLSLLDTSQNALRLNLTETNKIFTHQLQNESDSLRTELAKMLTTQRIIQDQIEETNNRTIENSEYVGFTAFGKSQGVRSSGTILLFPEIKSSFGISNLSLFKSTGIFTCEKEGLYHFSINVMSCSSGESFYYVYKNNVAFPLYYISSGTADTKCNSATGVILTQLNVNDNVYVKTGPSAMNVYDMYSSFTVTKLK